MFEYLCDPWPLEGCCDFVALGVSPAVTGLAWEAASEALWLATGRQFGNCPVTLRPCRDDCHPEMPRGIRYGTVVDQGWGYPYPALIDGAWINLACGNCPGECGCSKTSQVLFPDLVNQLVSVTIDGATLPVTGYDLQDRQRLVRLGGSEWPLCQDWTVTGGPGTWLVEVSFGDPVPPLGKLAVAALTCEIAKLCSGLECGLPMQAQTVTRQGVTFRGGADFLDEGFTGLYIADMFIKRYNPHQLTDRARAYSVDKPPPRLVGP